MSAQHTPPVRTIRGRTSALAVGVLATVALALTCGPASASERRTAHRPSGPQAIELASQNQDRAAFDIFRYFSNCLYLAAPDPEHQMYPSKPGDFENRVNACLGL